jgi:hypothetical protein
MYVELRIPVLLVCDVTYDVLLDPADLDKIRAVHSPVAREQI